jgi:hypothetical protein
MPVAAAIIGAAAIGGGAQLIAGHNAASAASDAAQANNALEGQIYQSDKALETPFIEGGDLADSELQGFLGLGGDPAAASAAFQKYLDSTGYQFARDQGLNAVTSDKAVAGLLDSGSTLKALDAYGTGLARQYGQQYAGDLQNLVGTGAGAANALAGQGGAYAGQVSSNNTAAASASGNSGLMAANAFGGLVGAALTAFRQSQGSSFGGANYNAFAPGA